MNLRNPTQKKSVADLSTTGFEMCRCTYTQIFSINIQLAFCICSFYTHRFNHLQIKISIHGWLSLQMSNVWIWRAYCTMPLYIRDLSIHGFQYSLGLEEPIPHEYWRPTVWSNSQRLKTKREFWKQWEKSV